jgi:RHS repeat-associated protein
MRTRFYEGHFFLKKTKYFAANYEKEVTAEKTREINYINTPYGVLAAYIKENGSGQMYYLYKDHLGSITTITDAAGAVKERCSFDAWGRLRNPDNWSYDNIPAMTLLDRGFTGHEHLFGFGLINMNGRMYDPLIGLMLSPDPYVQMPLSTQNYNRYSYALNNPLRYTDPTGWLSNPIYDFDGNFLGTDDRGLQGEAIIMKLKYFRQGMSHDINLASINL